MIERLYEINARDRWGLIAFLHRGPTLTAFCSFASNMIRTLALNKIMIEILDCLVKDFYPGYIVSLYGFKNVLFQMQQQVWFLSDKQFQCSLHFLLNHSQLYIHIINGDISTHLIGQDSFHQIIFTPLHFRQET